MADRSAIEWTDATWNPTTGCDPISPGCKNCYAKREWPRMTRLVPAYAGRDFGDVRCHHDRLDQPLRWRKPRKVFVNSMSDLFHPGIPREFIQATFGVMVAAVHLHGHIFQVLTKRPERMLSLLKDPSFWKGANDWASMEVMEASDPHPRTRADARATLRDYGPDDPPPGIWLGVSVENQATADERLPLLLQTPAAVRWISAEPLLGPVRLNLATMQHHIDWVVAGGESGPNARPMHPQWAHSLRDQCAVASVPFLFKQWGEWFPATKPEDLRHLGDLMREGKAVHVYGDDREPDGRFRRGDWHLLRVGKKAAGRLLDGVLHDAYPQSSP